MGRLIRLDRMAQLAAAVWVLAGVVPLSAPACRAQATRIASPTRVNISAMSANFTSFASPVNEASHDIQAAFCSAPDTELVPHLPRGDSRGRLTSSVSPTEYRFAD